MGFLYQIHPCPDPEYVRIGDGALDKRESHNDFWASVEDRDRAYDIVEEAKEKLECAMIQSLDDAESQNDVDDILGWLGYIRDRVNEMSQNLGVE